MNEKIVDEMERLRKENEEMKECVEALKEKLDRSVDLSVEPIEAANQIINLTYKRTASSLERAVIGCTSVSEKMYGIAELKQIADHILVYCKYNQSETGD